MKNFSIEKLKKIKNFLKKIPVLLAEHVLLATILLFFISAIFGGIIFYNYVYLVKRAEPEIIGEPFYLEREGYFKILEEWEKRDQKLREDDAKEDTDLF